MKKELYTSTNASTADYSTHCLCLHWVTPARPSYQIQSFMKTHQSYEDNLKLPLTASDCLTSPLLASNK